MIPDDLAAEARKLVWHIAPEFRDRNLYLLDSQDLAEQRSEPDHCYAYCSKRAEPAIRDHLQATGEWMGQGSTIVYQTAKIQEDFGTFRRPMLETTLHELAHLLPISVFTPLDIEPDAAVRTEALRMHEEFITTPDPDVVSCDHGDRFIRMACHVWFRAVAIGFMAQAHNMFAGFKYGLSYPHEYFEALAGEPFRMAGETFNTIQKTEPPAAFTALWQSDLANIQEQQK